MTVNPTFLIPDETLLLQTVAVLVLFAVLARFVLPLLRSAADEREDQMHAAEELLEEATVERETAEREAARLITEARLEAQQILSDARSLRELMIGDARSRARQEYASILARADRAVARREELTQDA